MLIYFIVLLTGWLKLYGLFPFECVVHTLYFFNSLATLKKNPGSLDAVAEGLKKALGSPSSTVAAAVLKNGL